MEVLRRKSCRAILLTPQNEILFIKISDTNGDWTGWITPGGGVDEGESEEQGLRRELREELGLVDFEIVGKVWKRFHAFPWNGKRYEQHEVYFLVHTEKFSIADTELTETEKLDFKDIRWWPLEEIRNSRETFVPRNFARYLDDLLANGVPENLVDVGD